MRKSVTIDWTVRENVRAHLGSLSSVFFGGMGIHQISRRRPRRRCWSRPRFYRRLGQAPEITPATCSSWPVGRSHPLLPLSNYLPQPDDHEIGLV